MNMKLSAILFLALVVSACGFKDPRSSIGNQSGDSSPDWQVSCDLLDKDTCFDYRGTLSAVQICPEGTFERQLSGCPNASCVGTCLTNPNLSENFKYHYYLPTTTETARIICSAQSGSTFSASCE